MHYNRNTARHKRWAVIQEGEVDEDGQASDRKVVSFDHSRENLLDAHNNLTSTLPNRTFTLTEQYFDGLFWCDID